MSENENSQTGEAIEPENNALEPDNKVNRIEGWRKLVVWPIGVFLRIWNATLHMNYDQEEFEKFFAAPSPVIIIIWHNRLFLGSKFIKVYLKNRNLHALISASRDGAWLSAFFHTMGVTAVRGSSSRRGMAATRQLLGELREGHDIAITPDGPRGPCYKIKKGVVMFARLAKCPILLMSSKFHRAWKLNSWDKFAIPLPFSRVDMRFRVLKNFNELGVKDSDQAAKKIADLMMALTDDSQGEDRND